jgi:hypothetical protein
MVKALLLRESHAIPAARTAPIVIAERFTDLVGLLLLACVGVFSFQVDRRFLVLGTVLILAGLVVISVEPIALFFLKIPIIYYQRQESINYKSQIYLLNELFYVSFVFKITQN